MFLILVKLNVSLNTIFRMQDGKINEKIRKKLNENKGIGRSCMDSLVQLLKITNKF